MSEAPGWLAPLAGRIEGRLDEFLALESAEWGALDADLGSFFDYLRDSVVAGGKRIRPAFCYWAFVGAGGDPEASSVVNAGAALEMLHAAALVHDDVIDDSPLRRGRETAHVRFGPGVAILLGDLAVAFARKLLGAASPEAVAVFDTTLVEVNIGQLLDVLGTQQPGASESKARLIARYKTAKYTVERPLHLGAALAAPADLTSLAGPLSAFGIPLGEAFQLRDDLLDVFGDPEVTGKPTGADVASAKPTLLAALAGDSSLDAIERSGARKKVEDEIDELVGTSRSALANLPLQPVAIEALGELASFVASRDL